MVPLSDVAMFDPDIALLCCALGMLAVPSYLGTVTGGPSDAATTCQR
jgi:hypothetical protein